MRVSTGRLLRMNDRDYEVLLETDADYPGLQWLLRDVYT